VPLSYVAGTGIPSIWYPLMRGLRIANHYIDYRAGKSHLMELEFFILLDNFREKIIVGKLAITNVFQSILKSGNEYRILCDFVNDISLFICGLNKSVRRHCAVRGSCAGCIPPSSIARN
jgi:hypothetical protein